MEKILWQPGPSASDSEVELWRQSAGFASPQDFHAWSVTHFEEFWAEWGRRCGLLRDSDAQPARLPPLKKNVTEKKRLERGQWFPNFQGNFAKILLSGRNNLWTTEKNWNKPRAFFSCEGSPLRGLSTHDLVQRVEKVRQILRKSNVSLRSRVVALAPNDEGAVAAHLGASSLGALWATCSPEFGSAALLSRIVQLQPDVVFTVPQVQHGEKIFQLDEKIRDLKTALPSTQFFCLSEILSGPLPEVSPQTLHSWTQVFPFDHPLMVLFSSGTTGKPKGIVHSMGGTLLQHAKEHLLHVNLREGDRLAFYTTTGWMMWNWLVSALFTPAEVVFYEGAPRISAENSLWQWAARDEISVLGTSAKFLGLTRQEGHSPWKNVPPKLREVLSTGSPLGPVDFDFFYDVMDPKTQIRLSSISGGTDIVSCFVLGHPALPVVRGEITCAGLGMNVQVADAQGERVLDEEGELVAATPFPSMPLNFWNDADNKAMNAAYFENFPGLWHHGDAVTETRRGSFLIHGRSDTTLNPMGVRIGSSEIYSALSHVDFVADALAVGHTKDGDERIVLFVTRKNSDLSPITPDEVQQIRTCLRTHASPRHVPHFIFVVSRIPHTWNGKKVEKAVKLLLQGRRDVSTEGLSDPSALEEFEKFRDHLCGDQ